MARKRGAAPTFAPKTELYRYVDLDGGRRRRASLADFFPNPGEDHLSVNAGEMEGRKELCDYYSSALNGHSFPVGYCVHQVRVYSEVGKNSGANLTFNRATALWEFAEANAFSAAYRHRPVTAKPQYPFSSSSHCGVEFIRSLDDKELRKFARRMALRAKVQHGTR